jgi:hypothetical protein
MNQHVKVSMKYYRQLLLVKKKVWRYKLARKLGVVDGGGKRRSFEDFVEFLGGKLGIKRRSDGELKLNQGFSVSKVEDFKDFDAWSW